MAHARLLVRARTRAPTSRTLIERRENGGRGGSGGGGGRERGPKRCPAINTAWYFARTIIRWTLPLRE